MNRTDWKIAIGISWLIAVAIAAFLFTRNHFNNLEIYPSEYDHIKDLVATDPNLKVVVQQSLEDNRINDYEYKRIRSIWMDNYRAEKRFKLHEATK